MPTDQYISWCVYFLEQLMKWALSYGALKPYRSMDTVLAVFTVIWRQPNDNMDPTTFFGKLQ